jgi:hypothetical protein
MPKAAAHQQGGSNVLLIWTPEQLRNKVLVLPGLLSAQQAQMPAMVGGESF